MNEKTELFRSMESWEKMKEALTDIAPENREAELMKFIDFICGMTI